MIAPSFQQIQDYLRECGDGQVLLAQGFEEALIGSAEGWFGHSHQVVALYDLARCEQILLRDGMDPDEAAEWLEFNVTGAYVGPFTPVFAMIHRPPIITPLMT